MIPISEWKWFGNAGHYICADRCRFHLCTQVGKYLVSTVGEFFVRHDDRLPQTVGSGRLFESMVFKAGTPCRTEECGNCDLPNPSGDSLDFAAYNKAGDAARGHMRLCRKWAEKGGAK